MSIGFVGSGDVGYGQINQLGLFTVLSQMASMVKEARTYQDAQLTNMTSTTNGLVAMLLSEPDISAQVGQQYVSILNNVANAGGLAASLATSVINRAVFRDNPQQGQTLDNGNIVTSMVEVIRQMKLAGATVLAMTVTSSASSFVGTGTGHIIISTKRPSDGMTLENSFSEILQVYCVGDSFSGGASAGTEPFAIVGKGKNSDVFSFDWPGGSGASTRVNAINGDEDNSFGNLLTNSGFDAWTDSALDDWTLVTGAWGTDLKEETGLVYTNGHALRIVGDGSTLSQIKQEFGVTTDETGTTATLQSLTQYSVCLFMRRDSISPAAGVLTVDLVDGNGAIIKDAAGVDNSFTVDLTALTGVYAGYGGAFRTPVDLPDQMFLRLRLTTALTTARSVYVDRVSMGLMTQLYRSGPYVAIHSGNLPFVTGDYNTITITNSRGAGGTLNTWQTFFSRIIPQMITNELLLPSSSVPNVSDALIS
jgi:hypothetical protein